MTLYVLATPIGNLEDITLRALRTLKEVDMIAAEDTRQTKKLLNHYQIKTPLTSYHKFNLMLKTSHLISLLKEGKNIALVSDAGTPAISDPGEELVKAAIGQNIQVTPIPGASSVITALSVAGLSTKKFCFSGFLPKKPGKRRKSLADLTAREETIIIYESPYRLEKCLMDIQEVAGERNMVVGREITKKFEEFVRGKTSHVLEHFKQKKPKGEVVILIGSKEGLSDRSAGEM